MERLFKDFWSKISLCVLIMLLLTMNTYARFVANTGEEMFSEVSIPSSTGMITGSRISMRVYLIRGAGQFLGAYSDTLLILNRIEMSDLDEVSGPNLEELQILIAGAMAKLESAKSAYVNLNLKADNTPYNPAKVEQLALFDYDTFRDAKGLDSSIFKDVEVYLRAGDVRGIFAKLLSDTGAILETLQTVMAVLETDQLPDTGILWRLNQDFARTMLFGQYAAEVFYAAE